MDIGELADRIAIRDLIDRYSLGCTVRDKAAVTAVFSQDSEWRVGAPISMVLKGGPAIGEGILAALETLQYMVQMVHSVVIDIDGDRATARSVIQELGRAPDGVRGMQFIGIYNDELRREADGWRFTLRVFEPITFSANLPEGELVAPA